MTSSNQFTAHTAVSKRVPEPYLRAAIAAFPLTSEESFRCCLLDIDPQLGKYAKESNLTRKLWRACEDKFAPHTGWSLERLISARDRGWFGKIQDEPRSVSMLKYLQNLAHSHLAQRAGITKIKEGTEFSALDAKTHYHWLILSLPEDMLLAALGIDPAPRRIDIEPPLLVRHLLDLGVAEIHQHIGAGMNFPLLWASALAALANPEVKEDDLLSPGAPLSEGQFLVRWLLAAAIARCALAEYLIRGKKGFSDFLDELVKPGNSLAWTPRRREILFATLRVLITGDDRRLPDIETLRDLYADIHPTALTLKEYPVKSVDDAFRRCDPIICMAIMQGSVGFCVKGLNI